jgi:hypothetical protein
VRLAVIRQPLLQQLRHRHPVPEDDAAGLLVQQPRQHRLRLPLRAPDRDRFLTPLPVYPRQIVPDLPTSRAALLDRALHFRPS